VTAYSAVEDLLTGDIRLPAYLDVAGAVQDATDEIDSKIGGVYHTPIDMDENTSPVSRPARLMLKRIANFLATGRLLLEVAAAAEQTELHAYAASLVAEATQAISQIADGSIPLQGAELVPANQRTGTLPMINNLDRVSNVEAFYDRFTAPVGRYLPTYPVGGGG
jgi:hypothetical protein